VLKLIERGIVCLDCSIEAHRADVARLMRSVADACPPFRSWPRSVDHRCVL